MPRFGNRSESLSSDHALAKRVGQVSVRSTIQRRQGGAARGAQRFAGTQNPPLPSRGCTFIPQSGVFASRGRRAIAAAASLRRLSPKITKVWRARSRRALGVRLHVATLLTGMCDARKVALQRPQSLKFKLMYSRCRPTGSGSSRSVGSLASSRSTNQTASASGVIRWRIRRKDFAKAFGFAAPLRGRGRAVARAPQQRVVDGRLRC